jgi:hypothetical protein
MSVYIDDKICVYGSVSEYIIVRVDAGEFEEGGGLKSLSMYRGV